MTMSKNSFMNITHPKSVYKGEMFLHTIFESSNYLPQQMWLYIYYSLISTIFLGVSQIGQMGQLGTVPN